MIDYNEFIEDIDEYLKRYTIYKGYLDIYYNDVTNRFNIKDIKDCGYYMTFGKSEIESIHEELTDMDYDVDKEGCYNFEAVLRYSEAETYEGRCVVRAHHYIDHINLTYDHSFISRERESKLNELFDLKYPFDTF